MGFIAVQGALTLEENTGRKFQALRAAVLARTGKLILITSPYGAFRTPAQQGYLRNGWEKDWPGFYYAAPVGESNHEDGCAFDINNWAAVGEQVIKEEAWKLGLVRDPSERWHWNNPRGPKFTFSPAALAGVGAVTPIPNISAADVLEAQKLLKFLGYKIAVDADYGRGTADATKHWQEHHDLVPDSIPGPKTLASLRAAADLKKAADAAAEAARVAAERAARLARETPKMWDLFWDDGKPNPTGYLGTPLGTAPLPNLTVFRLFERRITAAREGKTETFNRLEIQMMNNVLDGITRRFLGIQ